MATLNEKIVSITADIQQELIRLDGERMDIDEGRGGGRKKWRENVIKTKKLYSILYILFETRYSIVDNGSYVYNFLSDKTEEEIDEFIDKVRYVFRINVTGAGMVSVVNYKFAGSTTQTQPTGLPAGGYNNWFVTKNTDGNYVWKQFPYVFEAPKDLV